MAVSTEEELFDRISDLLYEAAGAGVDTDAILSAIELARMAFADQAAIVEPEC